MGFKSGKQRSFMFALDKDRTKGVDPSMVSKPPVSPLVNPGMNTSMHKPMGMTPPAPVPQMGLPKLNNQIAPLNPVAVPGLPVMGKLPKFGKMRNSLKGQFKVK